MFSKQTYIDRRNELKTLVGEGIVVLFGNNEAPCNYPANAYYPFRQDSSFLYYFGQQRDGLVGVIDIDNDEETLIGNDIDIEDIVWYGSVDSVSDLAAQVGVGQSAPMSHLKTIINSALREKRTIHFLPPYRHDTKIQIFDLLGIHPSQQKEAASLTLIKAIVKMRSRKTTEEIAELERAAEIGYQMHTTAMRITRPGLTEKYVGGQVDGIAHSLGAHESFATIFSQHGEIMHGNPSMAILEAGRLALCDAGAETINNYCSDNTRTFPVDGKFTQRQREIYTIVEECHDHALAISRPGVKYMDVHFSVCRLMTERLKELGLMRGDTDEAVRAGAHAMFLPHGLGHMMGMDVHDMEGLGQIYVGFDDETRPNLEQFGTNALRMGRRLEEGFVVTDEPGIYFIPALIDDWKASGHCEEFLNFDKLETYKDFGGIRIEDDLLITSDGCRFLGEKRIPYHPDEVEAFMAAGKE
ncbi:MAG: aminopeptidase P N-terminal domain-containing protein [Prevotella sp.]|nr:aminopeptidase P N-terminal domain-containing protein [Prevotella sp.]